MRTVRVTDIRVAEALAQHYHRAGLPADGGRSGSTWSLLMHAPIRITLPNFAWRKRALPLHDVHHLVTGYTCTPVGEFEMAGWEFGAGRFRQWQASLFCLPLIGLGAVVAPRRTLAAYLRGRRSCSLYGRPIDEVLSRRLDELRRELLDVRTTSGAAEVLRFVGLVVAAWALLLFPPVLILSALIADENERAART